MNKCNANIFTLLATLFNILKSTENIQPENVANPQICKIIKGNGNQCWTHKFENNIENTMPYNFSQRFLMQFLLFPKFC